MLLNLKKKLLLDRLVEKEVRKELIIFILFYNIRYSIGKAAPPAPKAPPADAKKDQKKGKGGKDDATSDQDRLAEEKKRKDEME